jgi:hypothetical protein
MKWLKKRKTAEEIEERERILKMTMLSLVNLPQYSECARMNLIYGTSEACEHCIYHYNQDDARCICLYLTHVGVI